MATKAQPVRIGPFTGGLNTYSDPSAVADEDAVELINFDVDLDGSLTSRPPIKGLAGGLGGRYENRLLGTYVTSAGVAYLIFACKTTADVAITSWYKISDGTVGNIIGNFAATAMVQYQNKAWLIAPPTSANPGGSWDGTTFTAVAALPKGETATIYKERIFVGTGAKDATNPARVFFSGPANPSSWTGTDFFDVNNGDGQPIVALYSYAGSVVIFKSRSTYVYAYESSPTKGQVQTISASVGLENADCVAERENVLYVLYDSDLYSISNWNWEQLNIKVPFAYRNNNVGNTWTNFCVSNMNHRIVVRYYDNQYVYNIKTRTWALWQTLFLMHNIVESPIVDTVTGIQTFLTGNYGTRFAVTTTANTIYIIKDTYTATDSETFTCSVKSKVYSMNVPYSYKRLMWWGVDLLTKSKVDAVVTPVVYGRAVRIADVNTQPISNFLTRPINALLDQDISVSDSADIKNPSNVRMFVKYLKSLRFRQVQFKLSSTIDGTTSTGPLQIYSVTAFVINKESINKKIN